METLTENFLEKHGRRNPLQEMSQEVKFSEILFSIRWQEYFPHKLSLQGYQFELSDYDECIEFSKLHHADLFGVSDSPFIWLEFSEKKRIYYEKMVDFFSIKHDGKLIGVHCGAPSDWGSYYLRIYRFSKC